MTFSLKRAIFNINFNSKLEILNRFTNKRSFAAKTRIIANERGYMTEISGFRLGFPNAPAAATANDCVCLTSYNNGMFRDRGPAAFE